MTEPAPLNRSKLTAWLEGFLAQHADDVFRTKGVLQLEGDDAATIVQGVHADVSYSAGRPWGDRDRISRLVFIGRHLHKPTLADEFKRAMFGSMAA